MSLCDFNASRNLIKCDGCGMNDENAVRGLGTGYSGAGVVVFDINLASAVVACDCASGPVLAIAERLMYGNGSNADRF